VLSKIFWCLITINSISHCYPKVQISETIRIFDSLSQIKKYAASLQEYPMPDNVDWKKPDFHTVYQQMVSNWFSKFLSRWSIFTPFWSIYAFHKLLEAVVSMREMHGYNGRFVQKVYLKPGAPVIVFGALYGAFHSLVRDLSFLEQQGIINENLKITNPDCIIVFDGNVVAFSPYILETLTVILRLMFINPDSIFYIKGEQENRARWKEDGLKNELQNRARGYKNGTIPLGKLINNLFRTLPLALYLVADQTPSQVDLVRISSYITSNKELNENTFANFFACTKEEVFEIDKRISSKPTIRVNVRAYIESSPEEKEKHRATHGLALISKENRASIWNIFSSPTGANRALYQFFYDSFIKIDTAPLLKDWKIILYEQDVRYEQEIKPYVVVNLLSGIEYINKEIQEQLMQHFSQEIKQTETAKKQLEKELLALEKEKSKEVVSAEQRELVAEEILPDNEIRFGTSMDLSRGISDLCKQMLAGIEVVFHEQNKKGGIDGKKISLKVLDDEYTPRIALANVQTLLDKYKIDKLLDPSGTPTLAAFFKLVEQGKILVLFSTSGSHIFRSPKLKYIIHYRSSFTREGEALARYAHETLKAKKIALIYQSDVPSIEGAIEYFNRVGFKNYVEITYERDDIKMDKQVNLINRENPDALIFLAISTASIEIIRQAGTQSIGAKHLLGWSDLGSGLFQRFIKQESLKFITSHIVPSPIYSQLPIVKEFRYIADRYNILKDTFALEGFICATIAVEILKRIKGEVTKEKIIEIAEQFNKFDLGGITLTFNRQTRELCPTIWLDIGVGEWKPIMFEVPASPVNIGFTF